MTKATFRPTAATRQAAQAKVDRKLAALQRRQDRLTGLTTEVEERKALYTNV